MRSVVIVLALSCLLGQSWAKDDLGLSVLTYNQETFAEEVPKTNHFVMFYAPWCGHCKRLHPTWEDLAVKFNEKEGEKDVLIAKVDCTIETALCSEHDVTGYPTLKFFKAGEESASAEKYRQARDMAALTKFINQKVGIEVEEEEADSEPEVAVAEKGLYVLGEKSFDGHIKEGDTFIKFYAPWCGHCQKLAPAWDELGAAFEDNKKVTIAKLDCTQAQSVCQANDVKGYPTLAYFRNGKKVENYRGARNLKELKDFVLSMTEEKGSKDDGEKEKVPSEDDEAATQVAVLGTDNFEETIKTGVTFIKFYAPWCGHCKRLAPTWEQLAEKYAGNDKVTVAKIDCTSDDNKNKKLCNDHGVNGFPTLNIYKDGEKVAEYSGKRDLEDLEKFVTKTVGGEKDEL